MSDTIIDGGPVPIDELKFVDADIADEFRGKAYFVGTPTLTQLVRNINKMNEQLDSIHKTLAGIKFKL